MTPDKIPLWLQSLSEEDLHFIRRFLLASGSLKEVATQYGISYPTVRVRLDRLIEKIQAVEHEMTPDAFSRAIESLVHDGMIIPAVARQLLATHRLIVKQIKEGEDHA